MRRVLSIFMLMFTAIAGCAEKLPEGVRVLSYATPYSPGHPFSRADTVWMDYVEEASNGRLQIRPYWAGSLISSTDSMEEIRHGVSDIGLITPVYTLGGAHLLRAQSGFYSGVDGYENQTALFRCMQQAGDPFAHELEGLKVLALQGGNNPGLVTRKKAVRELSDLEGMRIRSPSELLPVLSALGADPVDMPMNEVYSALAKGVIDGVVAPAETFASLHFQEVSDYYTELRVPRSAYPSRAMSTQVWAQLAPQDRAVLEASIPVWESAIAELTRQSAEKGYDIGREAGITYVAVTPEAQAEFDRIYLEEAEKTARSVARFGIDAMPVLETARRSVTAAGEVRCDEGI